MVDKKKLKPHQEKALEILKKRLDSRLITALNSCVHCGLCGESCHYYLQTGDAKYIPGNKVDQLASVYRRYHSWTGKVFPGWFGACDLTEEKIEEMVDVLFGGCTMCGRCSIHCSIGVDVPFIVRTGRTMLVSMGLVPKGLQSTIDKAMQFGNNMAIPREDLVDTLEWLEEDLQMEVEDENARIPMDEKDKQLLYTLNPREPMFFPLSISATAKIFYAAKTSWTLSTHVYDVTNYAYYSGDGSGARELVQRLHDEAVKLNVRKLVLAECGHGFRAFRWEGPHWIETPYPFPVDSLIEVIAEYIRSGMIVLNPSKNTDPITLHDPCNLVRSGGVIEEQRFVLNNATSNFIEMTPNREHNYCCGGGGGQLSMSEYRDRRVEAGRIKAEQIRKTGAKIVATPCHNCIDQLMELNQEYDLNVQIKTVAEIVADAIVLQR